MSTAMAMCAVRVIVRNAPARWWRIAEAVSRAAKSLGAASSGQDGAKAQFTATDPGGENGST